MIRCYVKYRMRNTTQNIWEYKWQLETDAPPTVLPDNPDDAVGIVSIDTAKEWPFNPDDPIDLAHAKELKTIEIDLKTAALVAQGFTYDGKLFSASEHAQRNAVAAVQKKDTMTYPFNWSTEDNLDAVTINNAADMEALQQAMFDQLKAHWDSGNALKDQVRAAADIPAVFAVADNR